MNLFFDTSALIKKYVLEEGSDIVETLLTQADVIYISPITELETHSAFKRLHIEGAITKSDYNTLKKEFEIDIQFYTQVFFDENISEIAKMLIEKYQLKILDSIQLSSALAIHKEIELFITSDEKLFHSAKKEKLKIVNPLQKKTT